MFAMAIQWFSWWASPNQPGQKSFCVISVLFTSPGSTTWTQRAPCGHWTHSGPLPTAGGRMNSRQWTCSWGPGLPLESTSQPRVHIVHSLWGQRALGYQGFSPKQSCSPGNKYSKYSSSVSPKIYLHLFSTSRRFWYLIKYNVKFTMSG